MAEDDRKVWQPLHGAVRAKLDPEYVAFHDQYMQYVQPDDLKIWDGSARTKPSLPPGGIPPVPVGSTREFQVGAFQLRAYTPTGECDARGWPVLIWYHGGGWAIGGLDDNKDFCTFLCQGVFPLLLRPNWVAKMKQSLSVSSSLSTTDWHRSIPSLQLLMTPLTH